MKKKLEYLKRKFIESGLDLDVNSYFLVSKSSCKKVWEFTVFTPDLMGVLVTEDEPFTSEEDCIDYLMKNYRIIIGDCLKKVDRNEICYPL